MSKFGELIAEGIKSRNDEVIRFAHEVNKMLDFYTATNIQKYCNGFVSIGFRTDKAEYDINKNNFILNSCGDGWFRKDQSAVVARGYGLMVRNINITSRKPQLVGDFICYKASIIYETNDFESSVVEDKFWVFVHKQFDIKDVVQYIDNRGNEWTP